MRGSCAREWAIERRHATSHANDEEASRWYRNLRLYLHQATLSPSVGAYLRRSSCGLPIAGGAGFPAKFIAITNRVG